jgi:hypothetical protein
MDRRHVCKSTDHLFIPVLEVSIPLLRCIRCNVYAYHDTVKQLARNRSYKADTRAELYRLQSRIGAACGSASGAALVSSTNPL